MEATDTNRARKDEKAKAEKDVGGSENRERSGI